MSVEDETVEDLIEDAFDAVADGNLSRKEGVALFLKALRLVPLAQVAKQTAEWLGDALYRDEHELRAAARRKLRKARDLEREGKDDRARRKRDAARELLQLAERRASEAPKPRKPRKAAKKTLIADDPIEPSETMGAE